MKLVQLNARTKAIIYVVVIVIVIVVALLSGILIRDEAVAPDFVNAKLKPSLDHIYGTDWLGRDLFMRTIKGLSISIIVGMFASVISAIIALIVGIVAATGSKLLDEIINWIIDLVMGIPHLILIILISFACGRGLKGLLVGIAVTHWTSLARLIRAEVLQLKNEQYIMVSRSLGKSNIWILVNHILPHMIPQFIVGLVLLFPHAILHESAISFLGYGLSPEQPAVGIILSESMKYISSGMWWLAFYPGFTLVIIVILFERLGEYLRRIIDPYSAQE